LKRGKVEGWKHVVLVHFGVREGRKRKTKN